jgi:integrase
LTRPGRHADGNGLYLAISENGAKSWVFMWKRNGRRQARGLGSVDTVTLADARDSAAYMRRLVREGRDPPSAKALKTSVPTFAEMATAYVAGNEAAWSNAKHRYQVELQLTRYAAPLRSVPVDQITTEQVLKTLQPIWRTKTETAKRTRQRIEAVIDYAKARGHCSGPNPAQWRSHLATILPSPERLARVEHHLAMDYHDVPAFMARLRGTEGVAARALEFTVLTAARVGEVRGATWGEISVSDRTWVIPAARMKAGVEHRATAP